MGEAALRCPWAGLGPLRGRAGGRRGRSRPSLPIPYLYVLTKNLANGLAKAGAYWYTSTKFIIPAGGRDFK